MSSPKTYGPKLFTSRFGGEQPIPPEFIALMQRVVEEQSVPDDVAAEALSDTIVESEVRMDDRTHERKRRTVKKVAGNLGPLNAIHIDDKGQEVKVVRYLKPTGSGWTNPPNAYTTVARQDLGNGWSIDEVALSGVFVDEFTNPGGFIPGLFTAPVYERTNPPELPQEFLAGTDTIITQVDAAGTAAPPSKLTADKYKETQEQKNQYVKRTTTVTQVQPVVPATLDKGIDTNEAKQVVTVVRKILDDATLPDVPTATKDVQVKQLGAGHKEQVTRTVPGVFADTVISRAIEDVIPPEFVVGSPNLTSETTSAGTAAGPSLGANELLHAETQVTELTKKTRTVSRSAFFPITLNDSELEGLRVGGKLFNGTVTVVRTVATGMQAITSGFKTLYSKVKALSSGHSLLETGTVGAFPTLNDAIYDPETGTLVNRAFTIVSGGTSHPGTAFTSQEQINKDHTLRIQETADSASFTNYSRRFEGFTNVDFPPQLVGVAAALGATGGGNGNFSETGSLSIVGQGSGSLSLAGQSQASASLSLDIVPDIRQPWGNNIPCTHLLFMVNSGESRVNVIAKCTSLMGGTVNDWPKFAPTTATFVCVGEQCAATARATASLTASIRVNYNGDIIGSPGTATSSGGGGSRDSTRTVKIVRIPPTIHSSLINGAGLTGIGNGSFATSTFAATAQISTVGDSFPFSVAALALGSISPTSLGATAGQQTIPPTGLYLTRLYSEPTIQGFVKMHAEIVNMANVL